MPTWETATDWDNATAETGVEHESVANTANDDATRVEQGYSWASPLFSSSLVGLWAGQETSGSAAYDQSSTGNDMTANGATVNGGTGPLGTPAWSYDGTDDYLQANSTVDYGIADGNASPFTILAWINWDGDTSSASGIFQSIDSGNITPGTAPFALSIGGSNNDQLQVSILNTSTNFKSARSSNSFPANELLLVGGTYDGSTLRAYKSATEVASNTINDAIINEPTTPEIGAFDRPDNRYFPGAIGPVWLHDAALSQSDIQQIDDVVTAQSSLTTATKSL